MRLSKPISILYTSVTDVGHSPQEMPHMPLYAGSDLDHCRLCPSLSDVLVLPRAALSLEVMAARPSSFETRLLILIGVKLGDLCLP